MPTFETKVPPTRRLSHLERLEAESIFIMREVAAEFQKPVMLYSIGKDSSVMLHLAMKAFYPAKPPFPLLHVDTTWKFRDMYAMRDRAAAEAGLLISCASRADISPSLISSSRCRESVSMLRTVWKKPLIMCTPNGVHSPASRASSVAGTFNTCPATSPLPVAR